MGYPPPSRLPTRPRAAASGASGTAQNTFILSGTRRPLRRAPPPLGDLLRAFATLRSAPSEKDDRQPAGTGIHHAEQPDLPPTAEDAEMRRRTLQKLTARWSFNRTTKAPARASILGGSLPREPLPLDQLLCAFATLRSTLLSSSSCGLSTVWTLPRAKPSKTASACAL